MSGRSKGRVVLVLGLLWAGAAWARSPLATVQERLGYPPGARLLILHADDTGMAHSQNRATFAALEQGWITSASILVPCPWFPEVASFARAHPEADLGIHLALNSEWTTYRWGPVAPRDLVPSLLDADGYLPLVETTVMQQARLPEVEIELKAQVERARGAGIQLTHLDTHMGTLARTKELIEVYRRVGRDYGLPILTARGGNFLPPGGSLPDEEILIDSIVEMGPGVAMRDWPVEYQKLLAPLTPGVYELILHLAYDDDEMRGATFDHPDWGAAWRQVDFELVQSAGFRDFLKAQGFVLVRWKDLARALPAGYGRQP